MDYCKEWALTKEDLVGQEEKQGKQCSDSKDNWLILVQPVLRIQGEHRQTFERDVDLT